MASHLYTTTYSPVTTTTNSKVLSFPLQPRNCTTTRHHGLLVQTTAAALSLRKTAGLSVSAAAAPTAVQVDVPETSSKPSMSLPFRVGHGFDIHRLEPGYPLIIGGIDVPHKRGCVAHSDGDVLLHCVVDAITGALGLPDIGQMFLDSDPKWKGAASSVFIKEAAPVSFKHLYLSFIWKILVLYSEKFLLLLVTWEILMQATLKRFNGSVPGKLILLK